MVLYAVHDCQLYTQVTGAVVPTGQRPAAGAKEGSYSCISIASVAVAMVAVVVEEVAVG
jgi:hypothetical protein